MNGRAIMILSVVIIFAAHLNLNGIERVTDGNSEINNLKWLDEYVERAVKQWQVPGLSVAVVRGEEILYAEGFGVKQLGENDRVDKNTLFGVASTTKAMTVAALGMLVDEGILNWDDRVRDHLPWFELSDPWVSDNVTIRDLLTHRVGIGRITGNRLLFMPSRDQRTIMNHIRHQPFEATFRSRNVYSNIMYMVAGMVLEAASGMSWDDFMAKRLFTPLNMSNSNTSITMIGNNANAAWPHQMIEGVIETIPRRNFDNVGAAASVNSSVYDMAQWMLLNLNEPGIYKGERILSRRVMNDMMQPSWAFNSSNPRTDNITAYGLGWNLNYYEGYKLAQHGGAADGMNTTLILVPELDLGIVVVCNMFSNVRTAIANRIMDHFMGIERASDWSDRLYGSFQASLRSTMERRERIEDQRVIGTKPALPLESYTGNYYHEVYGDLKIVIGENGNLELRFWDDPLTVAETEHWHFETFRASWHNRAMREKFVTFTINDAGRVDGINVTFTLRQAMIEAGIYPASSSRRVLFRRTGNLSR